MRNPLVNGILCACLLVSAGATMATPSPNASPNATEGSANAGQGSGNAGQRSPRAGGNANGGNGGNGGGNPKVEIAHCGCNSDGSGLEWKHIRVSTRAVGHLKHVEGESALCIYLDEEVFYERGADDCRISYGEASNNIGGLADCDPIPEVQTSCEAEAEPAPENGEGGEE